MTKLRRTIQQRQRLRAPSSPSLSPKCDKGEASSLPNDDSGGGCDDNDNLRRLASSPTSPSPPPRRLPPEGADDGDDSLFRDRHNHGHRLRRRRRNGERPSSGAAFSTTASAVAREECDECRSGAVPAVLAIATAWCIACWIATWFRLYRSLDESAAATTTAGSATYPSAAGAGARRTAHLLAGRMGLSFPGKQNNVPLPLSAVPASKGGVGNGRRRQDAAPVAAVVDELWRFDPATARKVRDALLRETGLPHPILAAYLEKTTYRTNDTTGDGDGGYGIAMDLRTHGPDDLTYVAFPYRKSYRYPTTTKSGDGTPEDSETKTANETTTIEGACSRMGAQWTFPTYHHSTLDSLYGSNVFRKLTSYSTRNERAIRGICPVDADPFLPWIHDAFPSRDGRYVEIVAHNKRRCDTDPEQFGEDLKNLEPQVALLQPVPVKRLTTEVAAWAGSGAEAGADGKAAIGGSRGGGITSIYEEAVRKLWLPRHPSGESGVGDSSGGSSVEEVGNETSTATTILEANFPAPPRYALAVSLDDADRDGQFTRFVCRFKTVDIVDDDDNNNDNISGSNGSGDEDDGQQRSKSKLKLKWRILGETLSVYPYNPENANYRKPGSKPMLTPADKGHDEQIWNAILHVRCPVPELKQPGKKDSGDGKNDSGGGGVDKYLSDLVASGESVFMPDGVPSLFLDLVPIRTPTRIAKEGYGLPGVSTSAFDPVKTWGNAHVLPRIEASGRWANVPICRPPAMDERREDTTTAMARDVGVTNEVPRTTEKERSRGLYDAAASSTVNQGDSITTTGMQNTTALTPRRHFLVACIWASRTFSTRGGSSTNSDDDSTADRLLEFLVYHIELAGFDHVYVYDNSESGGFGNGKRRDDSPSLSDVTDLFSPDLVTRISWPHRVCNNNRPMHPNPGERSSQYAAEASCRVHSIFSRACVHFLSLRRVLSTLRFALALHAASALRPPFRASLPYYRQRYGPETAWMSSLDVDEYLVPVSLKWKSVRQWLEEKGGMTKANILSFFQTRALPDVGAMIPYEISSEGSLKAKGCGAGGDDICLMKDRRKTYMETYNCEPTTHPKPSSWAWRAKKQIFRPDYVLNHFIHYAVVTRRIVDSPTEVSLRFAEKAPFERRVNELTEAYLLHTKTTLSETTAHWRTKCPKTADSDQKKKQKCIVGIAHPKTMVGDYNESRTTVTKLDKISGEGIRGANKSLRNESIASLYEPNCFRHGRVAHEWIPKLERALERYISKRNNGTDNEKER